MSTQTRDWQPGDIANGYRLGHDGQWRPYLAPPTPWYKQLRTIHTNAVTALVGVNPPWYRKPWIIFAGVVLVLGMVAAVASVGDSTASDGYGARHACEGWVRDQLKAPSTADFQDGTITSKGEGAWTVTGQVDAENGFGAKIRAPWVCEVTLDGDVYRGRATLIE